MKKRILFLLLIAFATTANAQTMYETVELRQVAEDAQADSLLSINGKGEIGYVLRDSITPTLQEVVNQGFYQDSITFIRNGEGGTMFFDNPINNYAQFQSGVNIFEADSTFSPIEEELFPGDSLSRFAIGNGKAYITWDYYYGEGFGGGGGESFAPNTLLPEYKESGSLASLTNMPLYGFSLPKPYNHSELTLKADMLKMLIDDFHGDGFLTVDRDGYINVGQINIPQPEPETFGFNGSTSNLSETLGIGVFTFDNGYGNVPSAPEIDNGVAFSVEEYNGNTIIAFGGTKNPTQHSGNILAVKQDFNGGGEWTYYATEKFAIEQGIENDPIFSNVSETNRKENSVGLGFNAFKYGQGENNNIVGTNSFDGFYPDNTRTATFTDADFDYLGYHLPNHNLGLTGDTLTLFYNRPYRPDVYGLFTVIDDNTLEALENFGAVNGGTYSLTPTIGYHDVNIIGSNIDPTRSNQSIMSGKSLVLPESTIAEITDVGAKAVLTKEAGDYYYIEKLQSYTVSTLPASPTLGDQAIVTDAATPAWNATVTGGGSGTCVVYYDGTNWVAH